MLYGLWDETRDVLVASDAKPAAVLLVVRQRLAADGEHAADALVLVMEDEDEGLHFIASGDELARMARAAAPTGDET